MRIAIITQPLRYNYGGILQNFALQTVLKAMGHQVVTLDSEVKGKQNWSRKIFKFLRGIFLFLRDSKGRFLGIYTYQTASERRSQNTILFIKKYINVCSLKYYNENDFDAIIVGSDQVWRPSYSNLDEAFLKFAEKNNRIIKVAYAASFGTDEWEYSSEETKTYSQLAQKFDAISVREFSGIRLCSHYLNVTAKHVLDPTMLLYKCDYINKLHIYDVEKSEGRLFYYFLDDNSAKQSFVEHVKEQWNIKPFTVNSMVELRNASIEKQIQPPVEKWLRAFYDAEFVITDSFHGCVFSMIFNKPFVVIANKKRGLARFNVLSMFQQEHRLITADRICDANIDISLPNVNFDAMRDYSFDFLKKSLIK